VDAKFKVQKIHRQHTTIGGTMMMPQMQIEGGWMM
jgi:hypothetical protein